MSKVRAFTIPGLDCWFYSDEHEPPHFHVKRAGEWEFKVLFLEPRGVMLVSARWSRKSPSRRHLRSIYEQVEAHRAELFLQWTEIVEGQGNA